MTCRILSGLPKVFYSASKIVGGKISGIRGGLLSIKTLFRTVKKRLNQLTIRSRQKPLRNRTGRFLVLLSRNGNKGIETGRTRHKQILVNRFFIERYMDVLYHQALRHYKSFSSSIFLEMSGEAFPSDNCII